MRRDSIFYKLFQQFPPLLFQLLPTPPPNVNNYRFDSVAVKEPKFEIDGVFLPNEADGIVYFCEVQFQKDEQLYERVFAESLLYFYRNRNRFSDWQAVVIYPSRSIEQSNIQPYRALLNSDQVHRVYLDELGDIRSLPIWPDGTDHRRREPSPSRGEVYATKKYRRTTVEPSHNRNGNDDYGVQV